MSIMRTTERDTFNSSLSTRRKNASQYRDHMHAHTHTHTLSVFPFFQGSAETLIRWGGKLYRLSVASFLINVHPQIVKVNVLSVVDTTSCHLSSWSLRERSIWWACLSVCVLFVSVCLPAVISPELQGFMSHSTQNRSFGDVLPSQSLGSVLKKTKTLQN